MTARLIESARAADAAHARARQALVAAVRQASSDGMTQSQIAAAIGRSQPEVSRLLHFHGTGPRALALRKNRRAIIELVGRTGGKHVRVFGSVATGDDSSESDIDLIFTPGRALSLWKTARLEREIAEIVGHPVDLVADDELRPDLRDRILREAIPL